VPKVTLVRGARQLLTLRGTSGLRRGADLKNLGIIQDGAVLIVDGRIEDIGPSRRVENLAQARQAEEIDASGSVVMPGFIDSHTQLVGRAHIPDLGIAHASDSLALARAIQEHSPRALLAETRHTVEEAVRHGTTTLESKSGFGLTAAGETKILRVHSALQEQFVPLVSTFLCAQVSPEYRDRPDQYIEWVCSHMLRLIKRRKLAEFADIRCDESAFSVEHARRYLTAAQQLGFALKIQTGHRPQPGAIRAAIELGATNVASAIDVTPDDAALLAQSQTVATLLPGQVFYLGTHEYAPARRLIDAGVAVALATGYNVETSPSQSMQMMIALACRNMQMTPAEAVTAATFNAGHALRRSSSIGSLESGKSADLLILSVPDYREIPYHFGVNLVELVMKSGTVLVERSEVKWPAL
jgi:imidazolonepropionase